MVRALCISNYDGNTDYILNQQITDKSFYERTLNGATQDALARFTKIVELIYSGLYGERNSNSWIYCLK